MDQSLKFLQKNLRIGDFEKLSFFESAILDLFFQFFPIDNKIKASWMDIKDGTKLI